jgi:hypothetical protein
MTGGRQECHWLSRGNEIVYTHKLTSDTAVYFIAFIPATRRNNTFVVPLLRVGEWNGPFVIPLLRVGEWNICYCW